MVAPARPATAASLAPLADPSPAAVALGPALLALYAAVVVAVPRLLSSPGETPPLARALAVGVTSALVAVAALALPVVVLDVPRAAIGLADPRPTPLTLLVLGAFGGVVVHYATGVCKPPLHALVGAESDEPAGSPPAAVRRVAVALAPASAVRDALLACGAVAALSAGLAVPAVTAGGVVVAVRTAVAGALTDRPTVPVADRALVEVAVVAVFLATGSLLVTVATHVGHALFTQFQIQRHVVNAPPDDAGGRPE